MEKKFVPYELAVKLKELGFKFHPFGFYNLLENNKLQLSKFHNSDDYLEAPLFSQLADFFRYNGLLMVIEITINSEWFYSIYNLKSKRNSEIKPTEEEYFKTYEEARLSCLEKLIELTTPSIRG